MSTPSAFQVGAQVQLVGHRRASEFTAVTKKIQERALGLP